MYTLSRRNTVWWFFTLTATCFSPNSTQKKNGTPSYWNVKSLSDWYCTPVFRGWTVLPTSGHHSGRCPSRLARCNLTGGSPCGAWSVDADRFATLVHARVPLARSWRMLAAPSKPGPTLTLCCRHPSFLLLQCRWHMGCLVTRTLHSHWGQVDGKKY
jgi:hypothetical protein